jgi:L-arabinose isomerase
LQSSSFPTRVGLFGIGLEAYWAQFAGLEERLIHHTRRVAERLGAMQVEVVNLGLVDSPEKARAAGHRFRQADVDLIFLYVTTYALSSTIPPSIVWVTAPA